MSHEVATEEFGAETTNQGNFLAIWDDRIKPPSTYRLLLRNRFGHEIAISDAAASQGGAAVCGSPVLLPRLDGHRGRKDLAATVSATTCLGHVAACTTTSNGIALVTDHLGSIPIYASRGVAGTNLFDVASAAGIASLDEVSISEFLQHGYITSPYTAFEGIRRLNPGSVFELENDRLLGETYWQPEENPAAQVEEVANEAARVMDKNLRILAQRFPNLALLYSGGEDSRVLAHLLRKANGNRDSYATAVTLLDYRNREYRLARMAAKVLRLPHEVIWRTPYTYSDAAGLSGNTMGGLFDAQHFHAYGMLRDVHADAFVDGWTSDTLMKGLYVPKSRRRVAGLPVGPHQANGQLDLEKACGELSNEIRTRRQAKLDFLRSFRSSDAEVYTRMWPISDHPDYGFFASNQAERMTASPFLYGTFADVITQLPEAPKVGNRLFWQAFGRNLGLSGLIPRSGGEIPKLPPAVQAPFVAYTRINLKAGRFIRRGLGMPPKAQGPWQEADTMRNSALDLSTRFDSDVLRLACRLRQDPSRMALADLGPAELLRTLQVARLLSSEVEAR